MPRDYCPRCAAEVPMDDGVCFFGHEIGAEDVRPPQPPTDGEPGSELEELAAAVATGEVESPDASAAGSAPPQLGSAVPHDVEPDPARVEDVPDPEPFRAPDVVRADDEAGEAPAETEVGGYEVVEPEDPEPEDPEPEARTPEETEVAGLDAGGPVPDVIEPGAPEPPDDGPEDTVEPDVVEPDVGGPDVIEPEDTLEPEDTVEPDVVAPDSLDESDVDVDALEAAIAELERREELEDDAIEDIRDDDAWDADLGAAAAEAATEAAEGPSTDDEAGADTAWEETDEDDRGEEPAGSEVPDDEDPFASAGFDEEDGFVADFELPEPDELDEGEPPDEPEGPAAEVTPEDVAAEEVEPADGAPSEPEEEPAEGARMGSLLADEGAIDALLAERDLDTGLTWEVDVPAEDDAADPVAERFAPEEFDVLEPTSDVEGAPEAWEAALDLGTDGPPDPEPAGAPEAPDEPEAPALVDEVAGPEDRTADHEVGSDTEETAAALVDEWDLDWDGEDDDADDDAEPVDQTDDLGAPASDATEATEDDAEPPEDGGGAPDTAPREPDERRDGGEIDPDAFTARRRKKGGLLRRIFG